MKISFPTSIAFSLLASSAVQAAGGVRRANSNNDFKLAQQTAVQQGGELDVSHMGITTEREGQALCDRILNLVEVPANLLVPFDFDCSCSFSLADLQVSFSCTAQACVNDVTDLPGVSDDITLPINNDFCLEPSYEGNLTVGLLKASLNSKVCSGDTTLGINLTAIEELLFFDINFFDEESLDMYLPEVCATVEQKLSGLESCAVTIDGTDCPCEICGRNGIQLDCADLLESYVPDELRWLVDISSSMCLSTSILDMLSLRRGRSSGGITPFINPILTMAEPSN